MSLEVVLASTDRYLTTTQAVKDALGISTSTDAGVNARIDAAILRASAWAERIVGYPLVAQRYRETVAGYGGRNLMLARTPLRAVSLLCFGTDTGEASIVPSSEFDAEAETGFLARTVGFEWSVPIYPLLSPDISGAPAVGQEYRPWLADYVAGFTYDGIAADSALYSTTKGSTSTGRTLPHDIEAAVIDKTSRLFQGRDDVVSKSVGDLKIQYADSNSLPAWARNDPAALPLGPWRRSA